MTFPSSRHMTSGRLRLITRSLRPRGHAVRVGHLATQPREVQATDRGILRSVCAVRGGGFVDRAYAAAEVRRPACAASRVRLTARSESVTMVAVADAERVMRARHLIDWVRDPAQPAPCSGIMRSSWRIRRSD